MRIAPRLLGSIVVVASTGAEAADFSADRAAPVDFVKACNVGGMAGFVLPGSDACLRISGYVTGGIAAGDLKGPNWTFGPGGAAAAHSFVGARAAFGSITDFNFEVRQDTPYGLLRGYAEGRLNRYDGFDNSGGVALYRAFVQFGGLTVGKANSFFPFLSR
jgi:hypothetical protein